MVNDRCLLAAAFLHDIGKPLERCRYFSLPVDLAEYDTHAHARYSAFLVRMLRQPAANPYLEEIAAPEVESLVLSHHRPSSPEARILQLADWLASAERDEDQENVQAYYTVPLRSIFSRIGGDVAEQYYPLSPIGSGALMPQAREEIRVDQAAYRELMDGLLGLLSRVDSFDGLYALTEYYLSNVPAQTYRFVSDISLFDHARVTAALAHALYLDQQQGILTDQAVTGLLSWLRNRQGPAGDEQRFCVVFGDLSGIQNFIFSIPSKRAARSLKGRSVYLDLVMRYSAKYILDQLGLSLANTLLLGGGNFQLLLPLSGEAKLLELSKTIRQVLWDLHGDEVMLHLAWTRVSLGDLFTFSRVGERLHQLLAKSKLQPVAGLENELYSRLFQPAPELVFEGEFCRACGRKSEAIYQDDGSDDETEQKLCPVCHSLVELTDRIKSTHYLVEQRVTPVSQRDSVFDLFRALGYSLGFKERVGERRPPNEKVYALEDFTVTTPGDSLLDGFITGSYRLPRGDFEALAWTSVVGEDEERLRGDARLAYLKMDIDNLGRIFTQLFIQEQEKEGENTSLSRFFTLSRRIELFFNGYLLSLFRKKDPNGKTLYPVYTGGDDLYLIGSWPVVLEMAKEIRAEFSLYTGGNSMFTLSGGIEFCTFTHPVIRASTLTEHRLEEAKTYRYPGENAPTKDKIGIMGEVLSWEEFSIALDLQRAIAEPIRFGRSSRSVVQKIKRSLAGFNPLLETSQQRKVFPPAIWRFLYYLRDYPELAQELEAVIMNNLFHSKPIRNPRVILIAARLAEMETRAAERKTEMR